MDCGDPSNGLQYKEPRFCSTQKNTLLLLLTADKDFLYPLSSDISHHCLVGPMSDLGIHPKKSFKALHAAVNSFQLNSCLIFSKVNDLLALFLHGSSICEYALPWLSFETWGRPKGGLLVSVNGFYTRDCTGHYVVVLPESKES